MNKEDENLFKLMKEMVRIIFIRDKSAIILAKVNGWCLFISK